MFPVKVHYVPTVAAKDVARLAAASDAAQTNLAAAEAAAAAAAAAAASATATTATPTTPATTTAPPPPEDLASRAKATASAAEAARQAARTADHNKRRVRMPFDAAPYVRLMQTIDNTVPQSERGDMLVFLSGMADMNACAAAMQE